MSDTITDSKTIVVSNIPLTKCINGFEGWQSVNDKQKEFLAEYVRLRHLLPDFSNEELLSSTSLSADEANAFLEQHNFDIKLNDHSDALRDEPPGSIVLYIAAILKLFFEWDGTETVIKNKYEGTRLNNGMSFFVSPKHTEPIVRIKSGEDDIYMTKAQPSFLAGLDDVTSNLNACNVFDYVDFPSIEYNEIIDVSWMAGMNSPTDAATILEAVQQDKFSMNYKGIKIESAAAVAIMASGCSGPFRTRVGLTIDEPFVFWVQRNGKTYFKAYFAQDSWVKN